MLSKESPGLQIRRIQRWKRKCNETVTREIKLHVYGKRQTSDSSWEFLKIENEQIKQLKTILMDKKLRETSNLWVEKMNSKRQVKGKHGHVVQICVCRLTYTVSKETTCASQNFKDNNSHDLSWPHTSVVSKTEKTQMMNSVLQGISNFILRLQILITILPFFCPQRAVSWKSQ